MRRKVAHLDADTQKQLVASLEAHDIVAESLDDLRPATVPTTHYFSLSSDNPIYHRARRLPPQHNEIVKKEVDRMLDAGIIPSRGLCLGPSQWSSRANQTVQRGSASTIAS